jgi:hypothetical protein
VDQLWECTPGFLVAGTRGESTWRAGSPSEKRKVPEWSVGGGRSGKGWMFAFPGQSTVLKFSKHLKNCLSESVLHWGRKRWEESRQIRNTERSD